jgi:excisionase family DNA binding protein
MEAVRSAVAEALAEHLERQPVANAEPEFLTIDEVAELLRVDRKTVYGMVSRRQLPGAIKVGRVTRVHRATLVQSVSAPRSRRG